MPMITRSATASIWAERKAERDAEEAPLNAELVARGPISFGGPKPADVPHVYIYYDMSIGSMPVEQRQELAESANAALQWLENPPGYDDLSQGSHVAMLAPPEDTDEDTNEPEGEYKTSELSDDTLEAGRKLARQDCSTSLTPVIKVQPQDSPDSVKMQDIPVWPGPPTKAECTRTIQFEPVYSPESIKMGDITVGPEPLSKERSTTPEPKMKRRRS